jgi:hypothetical protein
MIAWIAFAWMLEPGPVCGHTGTELLPVLEKKVASEVGMECTQSTLIASDDSRECLIESTRVLPLAASEKGLVLDMERLVHERKVARDRLNRAVESAIVSACGEPKARSVADLRGLMSSADVIMNEARRTGRFNSAVIGSLANKMPGAKLVPWALLAVGSDALAKVLRGGRAVFSLDASSINRAAWSVYVQERSALRELLPDKLEQGSSGPQVVFPWIEALRQPNEPSTLRLVVKRDFDGLRWHGQLVGLGADELVIETAAFELKADIEPMIPAEWYQDDQVLQRPLPPSGNRDPLAERFGDWMVALATAKKLRVIGVIPDSGYALQDRLPRVAKVSDLAKALRDINCVDVVVKDGWIEVVPILPLEEAELYLPRTQLTRLGLVARDGMVPARALISELGGRRWHDEAAIFRSLKDPKGKAARLPVGSDPAWIRLLWTVKAFESGFQARDAEVRSLTPATRAALESAILGETPVAPVPGRRLKLIQRADPSGRLALSRTTSASFTFTLLDGRQLQLTGSDVLALRSNRPGASEESTIAWRQFVSPKLYKSVTWRQFESYDVSYAEPTGLRVKRGIQSAIREFEAKDLILLPKDVWGA